MKNLICVILFLSISFASYAGNNDKEKTNQKNISGKIADINGEAIAGAQISINETGQTFFADMDGNFKFSLKTDKVYSLSVSTIGYQPLELKSNTLSLFSDILLKPLN